MCLAWVVLVVVLVVLMHLTYDGSDAGSGCTTDKSPFEASAEDCAKYRSTRSTDEGSFAGTDAALVRLIVVATVVVSAIVVSAIVIARIVIVSSSTASTNPVVERGVVTVVVVVAMISVLGTGGQDAGGQ
jgi:hypothetical protein